MTTPELCVTSLIYDGSNRLSACVEPSGSRTSYAYDDDLDWVKSVQRPDGSITTVAWNDWDSTTITGPKGGISTLLYNVARNVRAFENPLGERVTLAWENNEGRGDTQREDGGTPSRVLVAFNVVRHSPFCVVLR
jgi:hypothetical protein